VGDLTYCVRELQVLGSELLALSSVMDGTRPAVRYDADDVGDRVHDALRHFSDNWDDKRELLTGSLRAVGGMATESAKVFEGADDELAKQAREILEAKA
jgi:hypothetical protein